VSYSPFFDNRLALATAANFGLAGNGRLYILDIDNDGTIKPIRSFDTQDGFLFGKNMREKS
jgi:peroxin-7